MLVDETQICCLKRSYLLFANNERKTLGMYIYHALFSPTITLLRNQCILAALPIATVRLQTGLAPGGLIGKIAGLAENPARRIETLPIGPKILGMYVCKCLGMGTDSV